MGRACILPSQDRAIGGVGEPSVRSECTLLTRASYSQGKATALVIDVGHQNTSVTALWEGMVLKKSELPLASPVFVMMSLYTSHDGRHSFCF